MPETAHTTRILVDLANGDRSAADRLLPLVYDELRSLASGYMARERADHTLEATAVVHEAYLRLVDGSRVDWRCRAHFFAVAARTIRRILVDHAREHRAAKRGGSRRKVELTDAVAQTPAAGVDLLDLDAALDELGRLNDRHRQVVELRFFGGLGVDETAHVLGVSTQTVVLDWQMARAWLRQRLGR